MGNDTISDILTLIRNADMNGKRTVQIPRTNITEIIVKILIQEGLVERVIKQRESRKDFYFFTLRYKRKRKRSSKPFLNLKRISTPGLRIYSNYQQIPRVLGGMGIEILARGILTDREARLERIGGESEFYEKLR